jgi:hypothetical protein
MHPIPKPQVLDPDRPLRHRGTEFTEDDRPEAELLAKALHEACEYADQLWDDLNAMRQYLLDSLPPDPRAPGPHTTASASPTGPNDEQGWQNWINAFAAIASVLCGPHGDSGFGLSRAREEAQIRRTAPVLNIRAAHPDLDSAARTEPASATDTNGRSPLRPQGPSTPPDDTHEPRPSPARIAGSVAVGVLALRGLRRPRSRPFSAGKQSLH